MVFEPQTSYFTSTGEKIHKNTAVQEGNTYEWSWYLFDVVEKGKITKANGKDFIQFTFAGNCLVDINFTPKDDSIIVSLHQYNIPSDPKSQQNIRLGCDSGWSFFLVNLKSVYEGGLDLRNKNTSFKGMLNN